MERTPRHLNDSDILALIQNKPVEKLKAAVERVEEVEKTYRNGSLKGGPGGPNSPGIINVVSLLGDESSTIGADREPAWIKRRLLDEIDRRQSNQKGQRKLWRT